MVLMEIKKKYIYTCCIYYDHVNKCPGSILSCFCITHCASNFIIFILIIISNRSFSVITMVQVCCKEKEYTSKIAFNCFNKWTLIIHLIKYCQLISNNTAVINLLHLLSGLFLIEWLNLNSLPHSASSPVLTCPHFMKRCFANCISSVETYECTWYF